MFFLSIIRHFCLIHRYNRIEIKTEELCSKGKVTTYKLRVGGLGQPRFIGVLKRSSKKRSNSAKHCLIFDMEFVIFFFFNFFLLHAECCRNRGWFRQTHLTNPVGLEAIC